MHDYDDWQVEQAYRQGLGYLSMVLLGGQAAYQSADWIKPARSWISPATKLAGQVVVCLTPYDSPKREVAFPVDGDTCAKHLDRLLAKCKAIVAAVLADDADLAAKTFDDVKDAGLGEFDFRPVRVAVTDDELEDAVANERSLAAAKKVAEEAHAEARIVVERALKARGVQEVTLASGYRPVLQPSKGGLRHFFVEPSVSLRVYGGPKKVKEASVQAPA